MDLASLNDDPTRSTFPYLGSSPQEPRQALSAPCADALTSYREEIAERVGMPAPTAYWLWNMDVSCRWGRSEDSTSKTHAGARLTVTNDTWPQLGILNRLLAAHGDVVVEECGPDDEYDLDLLDVWAEAGIPRRRLSSRRLTTNSPSASTALTASSSAGLRRELKQQSASGSPSLLIWFGNDRTEEQLARSTGSLLFGAGAEASAVCNNKAIVKRWCVELGLATPEGGESHDAAELERLAVPLLNKFGTVAIKQPYGASGQGIVLASTIERVRRVLRHAVLESASGETATRLVEGWYPRARSHNSLYVISPAGRVSFLGMTEQVLNEQKYEGSWLLPEALTGNTAELRTAHLAMARRAFLAGYHGVVGFDSFSSTDGTLFPVVEINARLNMSLYALAAARASGAGPVGCLRSYMLKWGHAMQLAPFLDQLGRGKLLQSGRTTGVLPLSFTGRTTPRSCGLLRFHLLYFGENRRHVESLRNDVEARLR